MLITLRYKRVNPRSYAREKPLLAAGYKTKTLTGKFICIRRSALLKTATIERKSARGSTSKRKQYSRSMRLLVDCFFCMYISSKNTFRQGSIYFSSSGLD